MCETIPNYRIAYSEDVTPHIFKSRSSVVLMKDACEVVSSELYAWDKVSGVYCFYTKEGVPLYVGQSSDLRSRIRNHCQSHSVPTKNIMPAIHYVRLLQTTAEKYQLLAIECSLIKAIRPLFNGGSGGYPVSKIYGYENLREWLNNNIRDYVVFPESVISEKILEYSKLNKIEFDDVSKINFFGKEKQLQVVRGVSENNIIEEFEKSSVIVFKETFERFSSAKIPERSQTTGASFFAIFDKDDIALWCGFTTDMRMALKRHFRGNNVATKDFNEDMSYMKILYVGNGRLVDGSPHLIVDKLISKWQPKHSKSRYKGGAKPVSARSPEEQTSKPLPSETTATPESTLKNSIREAIKIIIKNTEGDSADVIIDDLLSLMKHA